MRTCSVLLKVVLVVFVVGAFTCGCSEFNKKPAVYVTVLTYNIHHGEDANGDLNLDAVVGIINSLKPDLVALQEVDNKTTRVNGLDLTSELRKRTGMLGVFGKAMDYAGGEYGEAVLFRYPVLEIKNNPLPHTPEAEPRTALEIHVELPNKKTIAFVGTHLDHVQDETNRMMQVRQIEELFTDVDLPMILAGDLNAVPGSDPIELLRRHWTFADSNDPEPTSPSAEPKRKIDYIMFKPGRRWKVLSTKVFDDKVTSDHCPFYAVLELLPK